MRASFAGQIDAREPLSGLPGVTAVSEASADGETRVRLECATGTDPREDVFRTAVARGWVLRELVLEAVSLEDVFVRLTRHEEVAPGAAALSQPAEDAAAGDASEEIPS